MKRALLVCLVLALPAFGQEFGHASGTDMDLTAKKSAGYSGSFSLSSMRGLGATFGGDLVKDRVWFFASADREAPLIRTAAMPASMTDLSAVLAKTRPVVQSLALPRDFLSLHSTTVLSPNSFFTIDLHSTR